MTKYSFINLNAAGETFVYAEASVSPAGEVTWTPPESGEAMERFLTTTPFDDEKNQTEHPIDIHDPEDWKRVPLVIRGSYSWCEVEEAPDETDQPPTEN